MGGRGARRRDSHRLAALRAARFLKALARDPDVPPPLRWLLVVAVLPIPGPVDELAGALALFLLRRLRPGTVARHWRDSAGSD